MPKSGAAVSPTLADLSRAASTVSTSSSDDASTFSPPMRPLRSFNAPSPSPVRSPARVPAHMTKDLTVPDSDQPTPSNSPQKRRSRSQNPNISPDDFEFGDILGEGSFSSVVVGTHRKTGQRYAVKEIAKIHLSRHNKMDTVMAEKNALIKLSPHPGIVRLHWTFQDAHNLYFVLDLAKNGELHGLIKKMGSLSLPCSRYFMAQIVDTLSYMHSKNVIHRDLKPENLLLTEDYHIKLCDFGTSKILQSYDDRSKTMNVGTAQYVSPEYLDTHETTRSSDLWSLGCTIYQMLAGKFTFHALTDYLIFQKIKKLDYSFPDGFDPDARDLVEKLLHRNPMDRLGAGPIGSTNDMTTLKAHPFFKEVKWDTIWTDPVPPIESGLLKREEPLPGGREEVVWDSFVSSFNSHSDALSFPPDEIPWDISVRPPLSEGGQTAVNSSPPTDKDADIFLFTPPSNGKQKGRPMTRSSTLESISSGIEEQLQRSSLQSEHLAAVDHERGRTQMVTPIQGHGCSNAAALQRILIGDEKVIFHTFIEVRSLRRRASLLLARSRPPIKPKNRELVLTNERLVLVKNRRKPPTGLMVKQEFSLRPGEFAKDKAHLLISADKKGDRDIVLLSTGKTHIFSTENAATAASWVHNINGALTSPAKRISPNSAIRT